MTAAEKPKNRWARKPNAAMKTSLKSVGPKSNYWVIGKDGKRRGPAALDRDGVKRMWDLGVKDVIPLKPGEFWTTELRDNN
jgi:hypothetical protein